MKFGIIKERKNPPDRRVVFSPKMLASLQVKYPQAQFVVEPSDIRVFSDQEYEDAGISLQSDLSDCDVLLGVKEVPMDALIPDSSYFFFSHTIKKQPYNRNLLRAILDKKINLYDHETIVNAGNTRLIGFGRYAGIVGAYNTLRGFGVKYELFTLPKAERLANKEELIAQVKKQFFPPIKIVVTGSGKVGNGIKEFLDGVKFKQVSQDDFLNKTYTSPVYTQIDVLDYNKRKDGQILDKTDFYTNPEAYESDFERFTKAADIFIAGHFFGAGAPNILTREMLCKHDNRIKVVGDVSCDVDGPIACTLRATTIAEPFMGYYPQEHKEVAISHPAAILVMSVDNLPCELPKDASEGFGEMFSKFVMPAFFNKDKDGILARAQITDNGKLTQRFSYLQSYIDGE